MLTSRAITVVESVATLRTQPGPPLPRYVFALDLGVIFRWSANSLADDDGRTAIVPLTGGFPGAWIAQRADDAGAPLGDADATVTVGQGFWRTLPALPLMANRTITLDPTNAVAGDPWELTREDVSAYTVTIVNGGPAHGTLRVLPISARSFFAAHFDGTNFVERDSHLML